MKKLSGFLVILFFVGGYILTSCGTSPEDKTGTLLVIHSITPTYNGNDTNDVDIYQDQCADGSKEKFMKHDAKVELENRLIPGVQKEIAGWVKIEKYQIQYKPLDSTLPSLPSVSFSSLGLLLGPGDTGEIEIDLVPIDIKLELAQDLVTLGKTNTVVHYDAVVTIWAKTEFGDYLNATQSVTLNFADYDNCK